MPGCEKPFNFWIPGATAKKSGQIEFDCSVVFVR
jgi:hypothetical protein